MKRTWLIAAIGSLASGFLMAPAQAAPVSGVTGDLRVVVAGETAEVAKVHSRGYRYRYHRRHHHHGFHHWRKPGIHLYLGHRRHHHHHHRRFRRW